MEKTYYSSPSDNGDGFLGITVRSITELHDQPGRGSLRGVVEAADALAGGGREHRVRPQDIHADGVICVQYAFLDK